MVRQRVTFQRRQESQDEYGQISTTWTDIYEVSAAVTKQAFSETSSQQREVSFSAYNLVIPYSPMSLELTSRDAVMLDGTRFTIDQVDTTTDWRKAVRVAVSQRNMENE